jgi:hypothetical protein
MIKGHGDQKIFHGTVFSLQLKMRSSSKEIMFALFIIRKYIISMVIKKNVNYSSKSKS